ncbi:helix-turn-helix domain-containing protein [Sciscionella sediminilitoris]|uniref:helix-turn-helix domain-containing protein n=1 Tax=Sciscionella sediminilitoris TaxID=1445613 RepID=UPI00068AF14D|nr:helix-turn-helix domain-containing protein [Sciscionella sp. SE31]
MPVQRGDGAVEAPTDAVLALTIAELGERPNRIGRLDESGEHGAYGSLDAVHCAEDVFPRRAADGTLPGFLRAALTALRPGGVLVAAVPVFREPRPVTAPPRVLRHDGGRELITSVWEWSADGGSYSIDVLRLRKSGGRWVLVDTATTVHRVLPAEQVRSLLAEAGFTRVRVSEPAATGHPVPLWLGVRP